MDSVASDVTIMNCELRSMWKEVAVAYFITQHMAGLFEEIYSNTKDMEALCPSQMLAILNQTTRCLISDDSSLYVHQRELVENR